jgi:CxxC motif-containing protein
MDSDDHILAKKTNTEPNYMTAAKKIVTKRYLPVLEAQLKTATVMAEENIPNRKFLTLIDLQVNFP